MDLEEFLQRITNMERILELGNRQVPDIEMTSEQLRANNRFLRGMLTDVLKQQEEANQNTADREEKQKLLAIIKNLQSQLAENKKMRFGRKRGVEISAIYHTIIGACKLSGMNPRAYLKRFFQEISTGRTDFDNLLPATIGRV